MSVEQVTRGFFASWSTGKMADHVAPDAMASGGILPHAMPVTEAFHVIEALRAAMPDFKIAIEKLTVQGDLATVETKWRGTQTAALNVPGMPVVPPSGKKVLVNDNFVVTVHGDKVTHLQVESPVGGGIPGALAQLGVKTPTPTP